MSAIRSIAPLAALAVATVVLLACSTAPSPRPDTPDDAIKAAIAEVGFDSAEQLFLGNCADRSCVVVAKGGDPRSIALIVLESAAPYRVKASTTGQVADEAGTMDEMGTDDTEFVYGRITDARISTLELDLLDGGTLAFAVATPGYAIAYAAERGPVQAWRFLDRAGHVVREQRSGP